MCVCTCVCACMCVYVCLEAMLLFKYKISHRKHSIANDTRVVVINARGFGPLLIIIMKIDILALLCPPLVAPENGDVSVPSREVGSTATYTCNTGFFLSGLRRRSCQTDGSWFGDVPSCIPGRVI